MFRRMKLSEIGQIVAGGTPKTKIEKYWNGDVSWITPKDLSSHAGMYISRGERNISQEGLDNSSAKLLPKGTVLFTSRAPIGYVAIARNEVTTNQGFKSIIVDDKNDNIFVYYLLKNNIGLIENHANGSTFKEISGAVMKNLEFDIPSLMEQKAIAHILSTLDDKIEVNNQINKTLENMAQAIFKQWFVDFEFPNEDGEPYKSSGGEMVESELGMIPKGWEVGTLNDISLDIITGKTPSTKDKNNFNGDIPFVKIPDMHGKVFVTKTESYLSDKGAVKNKIIPPNSIIVSCIATPGLVSLASEECQTNQQINTIINKYEKMYYYTYFLLISLSEHIRTLGSTGSTTLNLNKGQFSKIKVIIPHRKATNNYHDLVDPLFKEILTNAALDEELTQIRDTLLPKLMSGKIRVPLDSEDDAS